MLGTHPKNSGDCAPSILICTSNTNTNASGWVEVARCTTDAYLSINTRPTLFKTLEHAFGEAIGGVPMFGTHPQNGGDCTPSMLIVTSNTNTNASGWVVVHHY